MRYNIPAPLSSENESMWRQRAVWIFLQLIVICDYFQGAKKLTLIFMYALDVHIKYAVRIKSYACFKVIILCKSLFVVLFYL